MFYVFALGSMLGYALQNVLLARYARRIDGLSLAFYRNLSFTVTLLPLLIGSSPAEILTVLAHWRLLLFGGLSGGVYLGLFYRSYKYLPVGIAGALSRAVMTVLLAAVSWMFLGEKLSVPTLALIAVVIVGSFLLSGRGNEHAHLGNRLALGVTLAVFSAIPLTATNVTPTILSRVANPLVSGYFWEFSIAVGAGLLLLLRLLFFRRPIDRIDARTFGGIALAVSPTLVGTGLFTLAMRAGPAAVVTAIGSASLVITSLLAWRLYREHLTWLQWGAILLVLVGVAGLKFV